MKHESTNIDQGEKLKRRPKDYNTEGMPFPMSQIYFIFYFEKPKSQFSPKPVQGHWSKYSLWVDRIPHISRILTRLVSTRVRQQKKRVRCKLEI